MLEELGHLRSWRERQDDASAHIALGLVLKTWGSAPRRAGSLMLINSDGQHAGSLSGGCVEASVLAAAESPLPAPKSLIFDVAHADAWSIGLACGGEINIHIQTIDETAQLALIEAEALLKTGRSAHITIDRASGAATCTESNSLALDTHVEVSEDEIHWHMAAPLRLLVAGAVHISQSLCVLAHQLDYAIELIDPRPGFAEARSFSGYSVFQGWPDDYVEEQAITAQTACLALTHDPKIDDIMLGEALKSDAFYIGALGSRKSHAKRQERLIAEGFDRDTVERIRGPVGLDIGAANPAEIALSIIAEITAMRRKSSA